MTFTVRLVGGNSSHEGRLEVNYNDTWGSVCDDGFTDAAASVVCRSIGFTYVGFIYTWQFVFVFLNDNGSVCVVCGHMKMRDSQSTNNVKNEGPHM